MSSGSAARNTTAGRRVTRADAKAFAALTRLPAVGDTLHVEATVAGVVSTSDDRVAVTCDCVLRDQRGRSVAELTVELVCPAGKAGGRPALAVEEDLGLVCPPL